MQLESAGAAAEDGESVEELAARLQRIQAAASYAEGDVESDADAEQARIPPIVVQRITELMSTLLSTVNLCLADSRCP